MDRNRPWQELPLAVVDTETTGLNPAQDRIIEIAIIHFEGGNITNTWESLINPEMELPADTTRITGITEKDIVDAPPFRELAATVRGHLKGRILVAYNLEFDRRFLENELKRVGLALPQEAALDPLIFARELHRDKGSKKLGAVAERLSIDHRELHRAASDAELAGKVLYAFAPFLPPTLSALLTLQGQWAAQQEQEMASWRSRRGVDAQPERDSDLEEAHIKTPHVATDDDGTITLGPAFIFGREVDPLKALYQSIRKGSRNRQ